MLILAGTRTRSASEDFIAILKNLHRITIVGERTGGTTSQPYFFKLVGPISAAVCAVKTFFSDGTEFVGSGIAPDYEVKHPINDFLKGNDTIQKKAVELIQKMKEQLF